MEKAAQIEKVYALEFNRCEGCSLTFKDLALMWPRELVKLLASHNVIASSFKCLTCNHPSYFSYDDLSWRCRRVKPKSDSKEKKVQCNTKRSINTGTFFDQAHTQIGVGLEFIYLYLMGPHFKQKDLASQTKWAPCTVINWSKQCRKVLEFWALENSVRIGGPDVSVEINSYKKRDKQWDLVGWEKETEKSFCVPLEPNSAEKFISLIEEWVIPGTKIISDCLKSYDSSDKSIQHLIESNSLKFVERKSSGRLNFSGNFPQYKFIKAHSDICSRFHTFLDSAGKLYPPDSKRNRPVDEDMEDQVQNDLENPLTDLGFGSLQSLLHDHY